MPVFISFYASEHPCIPKRKSSIFVDDVALRANPVLVVVFKWLNPTWTITSTLVWEQDHVERRDIICSNSNPSFLLHQVWQGYFKASTDGSYNSFIPSLLYFFFVCTELVKYFTVIELSYPEYPSTFKIK